MPALERLVAAYAVDRLRDRDATMFVPGASNIGIAEVAPWMGWTRLAAEGAAALARIRPLADDLRNEGFDDVVLLGMGGSSLASLVIAGTLPGDKRLHVLDTTCPAAVAPLLERLDPARTVYLVASKSGSTVEPNTLASIFESRAAERLGSPEAAARRFVAITDPGSPLEARAAASGWRAAVASPVDVGGRYSALTVFGLLPALLAGIEVENLLASARTVEDACSTSTADNPAVELAAFIADVHAAGRDKLSVVVSPEFTHFDLWVEQLVAESLGKTGAGVVPVAAAEPPYGTLGDDQAMVVMRSHGAAHAAMWTDSQAAVTPVYELVVDDPYALGGEFVRWEWAIALVGCLLGVNPFDQPNVAEAKNATTSVLLGKADVSHSDSQADGSRVSFAGALAAPSPHPTDLAETVAAAIASLVPTDYLALLVYADEDAPAVAELRAASERFAAARRMAVTFEIGPRYLHSTGQLHKGGANSGVFLLVTTQDATDVAVPGQPWGLRDLFRAQAIGDAITLAEHGRRVLHLDIAAPGSEGLREIATALDEAAIAPAQQA